MSRAASEVWDAEVPKLDRSGMLDHADEYLLKRWCELIAQHDECSALIDEHGHLYAEPDGYGNTRIKPNPAVLRRERAVELLAKIEAELGFLSPSMRARAGNASKGKDALELPDDIPGKWTPKAVDGGKA